MELNQAGDPARASDTISLSSPSLIPKEIHNLVPDYLEIRPLQSTDYSLGHLQLFGGLTYVGTITESAWLERFEWMKNCGGSYYVVVIEDVVAKRLVGTGTLIVEKKFLFNLGIQGHIEDVAIATDYQGKRLGMRIIEVLDHISQQVGCYKTILDCRPENRGFI